MKVKELIEILKTQDPELEIFCYSEVSTGHKVFDINYISKRSGETTRIEGLPHIKFETSEKSEWFVLIDITPDS